MNLLRKTIALAIFAFSCVSGSSAQQVIIKKSEAEVTPPNQQILPCPGEDYLTISIPFPDNELPVTIARWDLQTLSPRYTTNVAELSKSFLKTAMYGGDKLFFFCSNKDGNVSKYEIDDKNGSIVGAPLNLFKIEPSDGKPVFYYGSSANKQFHYFIYTSYKKKEKITMVQGVILDGQMNKIGYFSYVIPAQREYFTSFKTVQADNGTVSILCVGEIAYEKTDYTPMSFTLIQIDEKGKVSSGLITGMPKGSLKNFTWEPQGDRLAYTCFQIRDTKEKGFTSFACGTIDPVQRKCSDLKQFELSLMLKQPPKIVSSAQKGLAWNVELIKTLSLSDGSKALILETTSQFQLGYYPTNTLASQAQSGIVYQQRQDLFIMKLNKTNTPQWFDVIPRWQEEPDYAISVGTACIMDSRDNVHLFFYDDEDNTEPVSAKKFFIYPFRIKGKKLADLIVAPDGTLKKQQYDIPDPEYRLRPETYVTDQKNKFFSVSMRPQHPAYEEHFYKIAHYKFTSIEIK